jgi:D-beta-D-heptose 7-phosphate kinase/D-beta-D-heptose 1-phosphate adenosyltransferase
MVLTMNPGKNESTGIKAKSDNPTGDRLQAIRDGWCPPDLTYPELQAICEDWRQHGQRIVFTNGCFDVLHEGHLELLCEARKRGERLVIALNPDDWIAHHKGPGRPLQRAAVRRAIAHRMSDADLSIVFEDETVEKLLSIVRPDLYLIGSDYRDVQIIGAAHCGTVEFMERLPGISTTNCLTRLLQSTK